MTAAPAPTVVLHREEWPDEDFEIPDGHAISAASDAESDKDDDDADLDWDAEMNLGTTGGARVSVGGPTLAPRPLSSAKSGFIPFAAMGAPQPDPHRAEDDSPDDIEDDEGVSTIKLSSGPTFAPPAAPPRTPPPRRQQAETIDEDVESDFALPSDLSQLSLRSLPLHHPSKAVLEWGDKDHTSSSTSSSDAYSTLGLGPAASPSSFCTSASQPETETEDDDDEGMLEGLVVPSGLFDSGKGGKELVRLLEQKKKMPVLDERVKVVSPDGEEDFEIGLVIDDDTDLSPSRFITQQKKQTSLINRSKSVPPRTTVAGRPPSRLRTETGPSSRPQSSQDSVRVRNTRSPTFVRPRPPSRTQSAHPPVSMKRSDPPPGTSSSTLHPQRAQTSASLRSQKSHGVLQPSGSSRPALQRKASLSTLLDKNAESSGSSASSIRTRGDLASPMLPKSASHMTLGHAARYEGSTAASRAKMQANFQSSSRLYAPEYKVPPTRPSTPSSNPAALRLTMPTTSSRLKSRPAISSIFSPTASAPSPGNSPPQVHSRASISPLPRPTSQTSDRSTARTQVTQPAAAKMLRKPKRQRLYGDGTELDGIEDLPTDRDKERKYRVAAKSPPNRLPLSRSPKDQSTIGRRSGQSSSISSQDTAKPAPGAVRTKPRDVRAPDSPTRRRRAGTVTNLGRRKPTLIRNLGGSAAPKVVGDMKWNPQTLRWEGNEHVLRDFDAAVGTSTRPALITQLTGSSIGSPVSSFAGGARIVGNMIFDPARMCWISRLPPEEDEPDVFADMADDEDDEWDEKGGTIRASVQQASAGGPPQTPARTSIREQTPSPAASSRHSRAFSDTSESNFLDTPIALDALDDRLVEASRAAELRHRAEMKGWLIPSPAPARSSRTLHPMDSEPDRSYLFEIRAVATKNYEGT
ncbi:hypothetical protein AURDEDRAFT_109849 [Auricularia subglabra TFB-10046 SS5]|nr:hypothetical protein AURDEDRAFT_109849 [Auricularia subglabra TFB-10046 SS5]